MVVVATQKPIRLACCSSTNPNWLTQSSRFSSSRQCGQTPAVVSLGFFSIRSVDKTYLLEICNLFGTKGKKNIKTDLKPKRRNKIERKLTLRVSKITTVLNYSTVLTSRKSYYPSAKIRSIHHHTCTSCTVHITYSKQKDKKKSFCM